MFVSFVCTFALQTLLLSLLPSCDSQSYHHSNGITYADVTSETQLNTAINYWKVNSATDFVILLDNSITLTASVSLVNASFSIMSSDGDQYSIQGGGDGSEHGGGVHMLLLSEGSKMSFERVIFEGGMAQYAEGGAVQVESGSTASFDRCEFRKNYAEFGGVGFAGTSSTLLFDRCIFTENNAENVGVVVLDQSSFAEFSQCSFLNNSALKYSNDIAIFGSSEVEFTANCSAGTIPDGSDALVDCMGCSSDYPANLLDVACVACPVGETSSQDGLECRTTDPPTPIPTSLPTVLNPTPFPSKTPSPAPTPDNDGEKSSDNSKGSATGAYVSIAVVIALVCVGVLWYRYSSTSLKPDTSEALVELSDRTTAHSPERYFDSGDKDNAADDDDDDDGTFSEQNSHWNQTSPSPMKPSNGRYLKKPKWMKKKQVVLEASDYMDYA
mmetsp:Transcript_12064/g.15549  ORF Transcript_12064/g.15549 Transcript_12064/m.15549 type:complete len:441 (-) Transcript_12064:91-1413(-)